MTLVRVFRPTIPLLAWLALVVTAAGCGESPTAPSSYAPFSQSDLRVGAGSSAVAGSTLTVHYTGWLYDGSRPDNKGLQFETSRGTAPFEFVLGAGQVIAGWERGVVGMNQGGLRRLVIPPSLAYGGSRVGVIPPNATLVFEIELLEVE
ncbi:MAG: FKBP-type peptidyl-prolyl cis-trans isomerase [Vicinamibacterales bacterium]|nr:FKBP-type peptidyl-prolyl cis-trans isomerase [Vicinamibacterales bacterium]